MGSSWIQYAHLVLKYKLPIIVGRVTQLELGNTCLSQFEEKFCLTGELNPHPARDQISTAVRLSRLSHADVVPHKPYEFRRNLKCPVFSHYT
ncbi:hypothetical protein TSAR_010264 [Trichomalopsis sarcophagae]|uniref:Uncharacterized protein n=1 Tax=Trichomalopsis sarcophagae TaxID=543379 RepID=A0A232EXC6_9HYME|nr:hypothetical protein TSAR_010264 [Trichomalopsis sarcophagae]